MTLPSRQCYPRAWIGPACSKVALIRFWLVEATAWQNTHLIFSMGKVQNCGSGMAADWGPHVRLPYNPMHTSPRALPLSLCLSSPPMRAAALLLLTPNSPCCQLHSRPSVCCCTLQPQRHRKWIGWFMVYSHANLRQVRNHQEAWPKCLNLVCPRCSAWRGDKQIIVLISYRVLVSHMNRNSEWEKTIVYTIMT